MPLIILLLLASLFTQTYAREINAHKTPSKIVLDGQISEQEWHRNFFQSNFTQMEPNKGQPSTETTKVAVQFDDRKIYVAFICKKSYPDPVVARETRRDQLVKQDDVVAVAFDTYHDSRSAFWFMTNALNTQVDVRISDDGKYLDIEWDTGWEVQTAVNDSGWTAEFAIPFKAIRFDPGLKTWGVNFGRFIPQTLETSAWAGTMDDDFRVSQFGILTGLEFPHPSSELRFIPYSTNRYETFSADQWNSQIGFDIEYRYQNNITGNFTYNPDFATVEGDEEKINMTRWELQFPEKRKFFMEGQELFKNRIQAFYSRRIGEINYGGKAIGKTGPYTFAFIGVNARSIDDNPLTSRNEAFPESNIGVIRLKRDVLKSSTIGMMFIDKEWKNGYNRVLSFDGVFHFPNDFHFTTQFVAAGPGDFKKNYGGFVRLARETNIYHYHLRYTQLSENFQQSANGVGFIKDDNRHELDSDVTYKWWLDRRGIKYIHFMLLDNIYWSKVNGTLRSYRLVQRIEFYFQNKWSINADRTSNYELFEKGFHNYAYEFEVGYNTEEWASTEFSYEFGKNFDRDYWMFIGSKNTKISDKFSIEYELRRLKFKTRPGDQTKLDDQSTWLSIATLNYQFTPDLFIRLFTQYRSARDRIYVYGLFGWRFKLPNSAVYLVYTRDDYDNPLLNESVNIQTNDPILPMMKREKNEILFLKFAYDFSL